MTTALVDKLLRPGRVKRNQAAIGGRGQGVLAEEGLNDEATVALADEVPDLLRGREPCRGPLCGWFWFCWRTDGLGVV